MNSSFVRDLKKLGRDLKDVIIVDNSQISYDNAIRMIKEFKEKIKRINDKNENISIKETLEISDYSYNNFAVIKQNKNK